MSNRTRTVAIGLALMLPCAAYAVPVSLSVEAPISAESLEQALSLRGVSVVAKPEAAIWHVRVAEAHGDDGSALVLSFRHRHGASASVRIICAGIRRYGARMAFYAWSGELARVQ